MDKTVYFSGRSSAITFEQGVAHNGEINISIRTCYLNENTELLEVCEYYMNIIGSESSGLMPYKNDIAFDFIYSKTKFYNCVIKSLSQDNDSVFTELSIHYDYYDYITTATKQELRNITLKELLK